MYELVGIGNALVDIIQEVPHDFLESTEFIKSSMNLVELDRANSLFDQLSVEKFNKRMVSGGSLGNSMAVFAGLGGKAGFIGKLGADDKGNAFIHDMEKWGLTMGNSPRHGSLGTGFCQIMVTPDRERTMVTTLGAASMLETQDLDQEMVKKAAWLYLEGYLYDRDDAKACFLAASELAHKEGNKVALTLSDSFCVKRHFDDFTHLVNGHIDLLFANEDEIKCLYQTQSMDEIIQKSKQQKMISIITMSEKGALVIDQDKVIAIKAAPVTQVIDMTGAGDSFSAGFLFGLIRGLSYEKSGELAAFIAAHVIQIIGGRPEIDLRKLAKLYQI